MFRFTSGFSENRIYRLSADHTTWTPTATAVDKRDPSHADYLWDEASNTLYVASAGPIPDTTPAAAIDDLPAWHRNVVLLVDVQGYDYNEAAEMLNLPLGTVKSRSFRAHRRLAGRLGHLREGDR